MHDAKPPVTPGAGETIQLEGPTLTVVFGPTQRPLLIADPSGSAAKLQVQLADKTACQHTLETVRANDLAFCSRNIRISTAILPSLFRMNWHY